MRLPTRVKQTIGLETESEERLTLPEPGRSLWTKTYRTVEPELKQVGKPRLGGGTLLAGRWKHRRSVDIDLSIEPARRRQRRLDRMVVPGTRFHEKMKDLGATDAQALNEGQIVVHFGNSKLDITVASAIPPRGERRATVHGHRTTVLSTTQVLSGKLARSNELLPRDAFDITTATHKAPDNLAWAANRVPPENMVAIVKAWANTSERWTAAARSELNTVADKHSYDPALLGRETAEALRNSRYRTVRIDTHGRTGLFSAETAGGTRIEVPFTRRTLNDVFDEFGIRDYLEAHQPGFDDDVVRDVWKACRIGTAPNTVYSATHRVIPEQARQRARLEGSPRASATGTRTPDHQCPDAGPPAPARRSEREPVHQDGPRTVEVRAHTVRPGKCHPGTTITPASIRPRTRRTTTAGY